MNFIFYFIGNQGTAGKNSEWETVSGGKAGIPGTYGCDHVIYVDGLFSDRKNYKGDYSNYLRENPLVVNGSLKCDSSKYKLRGIIEDPDAYAKRSKSYDVFSGATVTICAIALVAIALPIISAAAAVIPAIGAASWATGAWLVAKASFLGMIALAGAGITASIKTVKGLDYKIGVKPEMKMKNRQQVMFNNRYCDHSALRDETETTKNLRLAGDRSRGKNGKNSTLKEETERDDHSKSRETNNEFADAYEMAVMNQKANELKNDSVKQETINSAKEEVNRLKQEIDTSEANLKQSNERLDEISHEINEFSEKINENERKKKEIDEKINDVNLISNAKENELSEAQRKLLDNVDAYLNTVDKRVSAQIQLEFTKIKENGKLELMNKLSEVFMEIKKEIHKESQELAKEKLAMQNEIEAKRQEKIRCEEEIKVLRDKEFDVIKGRIEAQKEINDAEAFEKKMKTDNETESKVNTVEETTVMKEFKKVSKKAEIDEVIDLAKYKSFKRNISLDIYQSLFDKKIKYPDLSQFINKLIVGKTSNDQNSALGMLEFIIYAYKYGLYEDLKKESENTKTSRTEKIMNFMKDENKYFQINNLFNEIFAVPSKLTGIYEKIAELFFKFNKKINLSANSIENDLNSISLMMHYEYVKNDSLSDFEMDIVDYLVKVQDKICTKENIQKTFKLLKGYRAQIDLIGVLTYTALGVTDARINNFYNLIIMSIRNSLEIEENKWKLIWPFLNDFLDLIQFVANQLKEINQIKLFETWNLMQNEEIFLNNLFKNMEFVRGKRNEIESIKSNRQKEIGIFKFQLVEECLQPMLLNVLVGKKEPKEFNSLMNDILKSKITRTEEKDEFLLELKLKNAVARNNCVSPQGFMVKYQLLLNSNSKQFNFLEIFETIMSLNISSDGEEGIFKMFQEYIYLIREDKLLNFEQLYEIHLQILHHTNAFVLKYKPISQFFIHTELIISEKLEEMIRKSISLEPIKDFEDLFYSILKQRIGEVEDNYDEKLLRKITFYNQIFKLSNEFKNDEDKAKKVTVVLAYSNGTMGKERSKELNEDDKKFLKKLEIDSSNQNYSCVAYEEAVFMLSKLQYNIMDTTVNLSKVPIDDKNAKNTLTEKLKNYNNKYNKIIDEIGKANSINPAIVSLKQHLVQIKNDSINQERKKKMSNQCKIGHEDNFIKEADKLRKELIEKELIDKNKANNEFLNLVKNCINSTLVKPEASNDFILSLVGYHCKHRTSNQQDYIFSLINEIEIEEFFQTEKLEVVVEYLITIKGFDNIPKIYKNFIIKQIEDQYKKLVEDVKESANELSINNQNDNVSLLSNVLKDFFNDISNDEITKTNAELILNSFKTLKKYSIQSKNAETKTASDATIEADVGLKAGENQSELINSIHECMHQNFKKILGEVNKKFKIDPQNDIVYEILRFIKEFISDEKLNESVLLKKFFHYLNLRINLNVETSKIKNTNIAHLEDYMNEISKEFYKQPTYEKRNLIIEYIDRANKILIDWYMQNLRKLTDDIKNSLDNKRMKFIGIIDDIIEFYKKKLDTKNKLIIKSRGNFVREIIGKLHRKHISKTFQALDEMFECLKSEVEKKENAIEIEEYLQNKLNTLVLDDSLRVNDNSFSSVDDVFSFLLGEYKSFIEFLDNSKPKLNQISQNHDEITKRCIPLISIVQDLYFYNYEQQLKIKAAHKELMSYFNRYVYSNKERTNELAQVKVNLDKVMSSKYYKTDNYAAFIDSHPIKIDLVDINVQVVELLNMIEQLFDNIYLAINEQLSIPHKVSSIFNLIKEELLNLNEIYFQFNEFTIKTKFESLIEHQVINECKLVLKEIENRRLNILNNLKSSDNSIYLKLKKKDILFISRQLKLDFLKNYQNILSTNLNYYNNNDTRVLKQIDKIRELILNTKSQNLKVYLCIVYNHLFKNINDVTPEELNQIGEVVLRNWYFLEISPDYIDEKVIKVLQHSSCMDVKKLSDYYVNINYYLQFLSTNPINKNQILNCAKSIWKQIENHKTFCSDELSFYSLMLNYLHKCFNFKEKSAELTVHRIIITAIKKVDEIIDSIVLDARKEIFLKLFEHLVNVNYNQTHADIISLFIKSFGYNLFIREFLDDFEFKLVSGLNENIVKTILIDNPVLTWQDELEKIRLKVVCETMFDEDKKQILNFFKENNKADSFKNYLDTFITSSDINDCNASLTMLKENDNIGSLSIQLDSIKLFKLHLFTLYDTKINREKFYDLLMIIKNMKKENKISLVLATNIIAYSKILGEEIHEFTKVCENSTGNLSKQVHIITIGHLLMKTFNTRMNEKEIKANKIMEKIYKNVPDDNEIFLKILVDRINYDFETGLRYESSEVDLLIIIIELCFKIALYRKDILSTLTKLPILKWHATLRIEIIKYELNIENNELYNDLLFIEKNRGTEITNRFIDIIKNVEIKDLLLRYMVKKFKKNEWDLNRQVLDAIEKNKNTSEWLKIIKDYDTKSKNIALKRSELTDEMKRLEGTGEINSSITKLLERKGKKCILELCLDALDSINIKPSSLFQSLTNTIKEYREEDIKEWIRQYKLTRIVNLPSINCDQVLELVAVISRGVEKTYEYPLRDTQKIALLLFIDSIIFNYSGRLANISTGEGKSLITMSTAIAYIAIKGGNVDILTSSEILAERDAIESSKLFKIFDISVSNNCDWEANTDEKARKQRYEDNKIIYGEIGHFQRDILLTKYYEKEIRKELAPCLIIDEVDSMCIDNICNTLYISHQIADLCYLKEIYCYIWQAVNNRDATDYSVVNVEKITSYIEKLIEEKHIHVPHNLNNFIKRRLKIWINNAYVAKERVEEGNHYSLLKHGKRTGEAVINDLQTGVEQMNTQWSEGLQQFIQLKHTSSLTEESLKAIFMSNYIFFDQYRGNIYGMTGTLGANIERDLLAKAYNLDFFQLPRFKKELNIKETDIMVTSRCEWLEEIQKKVNQLVSDNRIIEKKEQNEAGKKLKQVQKEIGEIEKEILKISSDKNEENKVENEDKLIKSKEKLYDKKLQIEDLNDNCNEIEDGRAAGGRSVLIICENKRDVFDIVKTLSYSHKHVYEYSGKIDGIRKVENIVKRKNCLIEQVRPGDIIVATNVAGRGTDFKISRLLQENGGLHVIVSYLPLNIRVEQQALGRSGRKGENGSGCMIFYEENAKQKNDFKEIDILKNERDQLESERLHEIRVKMIPRIFLEKDLFDKFDILQKEIRESFKSKERQYRDLQMKSLHNKWAFWLDEMSESINNVYKSTKNKEVAMKEFIKFENGVKAKAIRNSDGIEGLIDEPGELIKLAKYNIEEGNYSSAKSNCDFIIKHYGGSLSAFSYYYKALALLAATKIPDNYLYTGNKLKKYFGDEKTIKYEDKFYSIRLLKKASLLFEIEIEKLKTKSVIISSTIKDDKTTDSFTDYFTKCNANEITVLEVHLSAAKAAIGQDLNFTDLSKALQYSAISENEAKELLEFVISHSNLQSCIKKERFSKKLRIKVHIEMKDNILLKIIGTEVYSRSSIIAKQHSEDHILVVDSLTNVMREKLEKAAINFSDEIYIIDPVEECAKLFVLPNRYNSFKMLLVKFIKNSELASKNAKERAILFESFKESLKNYCLNREKIRNFLNINFERKLEKQTKTSNEPDTVLLEKCDHLRNLIKQNDEISKEVFGQLIKKHSQVDENVEEIIQKLAHAEFTVFDHDNKSSIKEFFEDKIFLNNLISREKLKSLDLRLFGPSKSEYFKKQIVKLVLDNLNRCEIKAGDVNKITNYIRSPELARKNEKISFQILKRIFIQSGIAMSFLEYIGVKILTEKSKEIEKTNNLIEKWSNKKPIKQEEFELDRDGFLKFMMATRIIKGPKLKSSVAESIHEVDEGYIQSLNNIIKDTLKDKVAQCIDKSIREGTVKSKSYLILDNRDKEIENLKSMLSQLILSTTSPLKVSKTLKINYSELMQNFNGAYVSREVHQYRQLGKNMVLALGDVPIPWSSEAYGISAYGRIKITMGKLIILLRALKGLTSKFSIESFSIILNDLVFSIQSSLDISWSNYKLNSKIIAIMLSTCCGIDLYNQQVFTKPQVACFLKKPFDDKIIKLIKQIVENKHDDLVKDLDIGTWVTRAVNKKVCELLLMNIEKNYERNKRVQIASQNLQKLETNFGTKDTCILLDETYNEALLENDDRFSMRISHLIGQLVGPLSVHLSQNTFHQISLNPTVINDIANIINDLLIGLDKKIKIKLEIEEKKGADNNDVIILNNEPEYWKIQLNNLIKEDLVEKINSQIFSSNFNKTLNHVIKPIYKKQERYFSDILLELKKAGTSFSNQIIDHNSNYEN